MNGNSESRSVCGPFTLSVVMAPFVTRLSAISDDGVYQLAAVEKPGRVREVVGQNVREEDLRDSVACFSV